MRPTMDGSYLKPSIFRRTGVAEGEEDCVGSCAASRIPCVPLTKCPRTLSADSNISPLLLETIAASSDSANVSCIRPLKRLRTKSSAGDRKSSQDAALLHPSGDNGTSCFGAFSRLHAKSSATDRQAFTDPSALHSQTSHSLLKSSKCRGDLWENGSIQFVMHHPFA